jgi:hypothetical protein
MANGKSGVRHQTPGCRRYHHRIAVGFVLFSLLLIEYFCPKMTGDESDWSGFTRSIDYLTSLQEGLRYSCPAHNEARIRPDIINRVKQGIASINNNAIKGVKQDESLLFSFDGFSILTKA